MADITNLSQFLSDVADAIRTKKETTEQIPAENFDQEILSIETGIDTSDATATSNDIISSKTAYVNGEKVVGSMPNNGELNYTPSTEQQVIPSGYTSGGTISAVNNQDKTITENGTYTSDEGYTGLGEVIVDVNDPEYDNNLLLTEQILGIKDIQYIPMSYIESTGSQYINTGYKATVNTKIELCVMTTNKSTTEQYNQITGAKASYHSNSAIQVANKPNDNVVPIDYGTNGTNGAISVPKNTKFKIIIENNNISVNGSKYTQLGEFSGTCPYPLWIFDCNDAGKNENPYIGRLYYYKIYENNVLVRDFIPVMKYSNSKFCLYDKVENKFYYNKSSVPFIAGIEQN